MTGIIFDLDGTVDRTDFTSRRGTRPPVSSASTCRGAESVSGKP